MSAFLGPIHQLMYQKILTREKLIKRIIKTSEENHWEPVINGKPIDSFQKETFPPIEEVIDLSNIHSSLSNLVSSAEDRFAELIIGLIHKDEKRLDIITRTVREFGQDNSIPAGSTVQEAFRGLHDTLLDGMPCDRALNITGNSDDKISFEQTLDLHSEYWKKYRGDGDDFYGLRNALISGMLEGSGHRLVTVGDRMYELY
ncbi:MAG: hypothetical protein J6M92_08800 [Oribacterium sp.]|nr:hypothetical protein [Oribacterium sp.]